MDNQTTGRGRGRGRGGGGDRRGGSSSRGRGGGGGRGSGRERKPRQPKPEKVEPTPAEIGAAYKEASLFEVDRKSHTTVFIAQFRKEDLPKSEHDLFDQLEKTINDYTLACRSRQKDHANQFNLGFEPGVIEIGFLHRTPSAADRPPRIPMMKTVAGFSSIEGKHAHLKLTFSAPQAIPLGQEQLRIHTFKTGDTDPFSNIHEINVCIGQDSMKLDATTMTTITDKDDAKIPKLMKLNPDFEQNVTDGNVKCLSVECIGLHLNGVAEEHRSIWSSGLFTSTYTPYNAACEAEVRILQLFLSLRDVKFSLWCVGSDEMPSWLDNLKSEIQNQYLEGHPFLAYWINKNPLDNGYYFQWGQQYLPFEDQPQVSIGAFYTFPDVLSYCTAPGIGAVQEYDAVRQSDIELSTKTLDARFVEAEGFVKGAGYYVFTSAVDDDLISALSPGSFAKMDFGGQHAVSQRFPVTVIKPKFLAYTQKCFLAHRSYQSNERSDDGFEAFSNISLTAMPLAEFMSITSIEELTDNLKLLPPKKVTLHFDDCVKVPKRAAYALGQILQNYEGVHTDLLRVLVGQDMRAERSYNVFRCMDRELNDSDLPGYYTAKQREFGGYMKSLPNNFGVVIGGPGTSKTRTVFEYCGVLWTNARSKTNGEIQPERKFHQVLYTSDANATCEKAIEVLQEMVAENPVKFGNVLAVRIYTLKTEEAIISAKDKDKQVVDDSRRTRPGRYVDNTRTKSLAPPSGTNNATKSGEGSKSSTADNAVNSGQGSSTVQTLTDIQRQFQTAFPNGWRIIQTSGEQWLCGLRALRESMRSQYPSLPLPSEEDLVFIARNGRVREAAIAALETNLNGTGVPERVQENNFTADFLMGVAAEYAEQHGWTIQVAVHRGQGDYLRVASEVNPSAVTLWIHHNGRGHYEGLARTDGTPLPLPTVVDQAVKSDEGTTAPTDKTSDPSEGSTPTEKTSESGESTPTVVDQAVKSDEGTTTPTDKTSESAESAPTVVDQAVKSDEGTTTPTDKTSESAESAPTVVDQAVKSDEGTTIPTDKTSESGEASTPTVVDDAVKSDDSPNSPPLGDAGEQGHASLPGDGDTPVKSSDEPSLDSSTTPSGPVDAVEGSSSTPAVPETEIPPVSLETQSTHSEADQEAELNEIMLEMQTALLDTKRDKKIAGVNDHRLLHPEYSLAFRMLEIMRLVPMTTAMASKNPKTFPQAMLLWRRQFSQILEKEDRTELSSQLQEVRSYAMSLADLIITPLNNLADHKLFGDIQPDLGIADEATLSSETTSLIALAKMPLTQDGVLPATAWLNIGDPKQSNNVVVSTPMNNHFNAQNQVPLITRLVMAKYPVFEFTDVFRSCSGSLDYVNGKYYHGKLVYHESTVGRPAAAAFVAKMAEFISQDPSFEGEAASRSIEYSEFNKAIAVVNVKGTFESKEGTSRFNEGLINVHMEMIKILTQLTAPRTPSIACLAPYTSHVGKLEAAFSVLRSQNPKLDFDVEFGSIDGFQGRDKEFVIISYPNTSSPGFTANDGRFVSSVTRHKNGMVMIADCDAVGHMEKRERNPYLSFIEHSRNLKGIFDLQEIGDYSPSARMTLDEVTPEDDQPAAVGNWGEGEVQNSWGNNGDAWDGDANQNASDANGDNWDTKEFHQQDGYTEQGGDFSKVVDPNDPFASTLGAGLSNIVAKVQESVNVSHVIESTIHDPELGPADSDDQFSEDEDADNGACLREYD